MNESFRGDLGNFVTEHIAGDTNPIQPKRSAEAANEYVAQEIANTREKLGRKFDASVKDAMILANKTLPKDQGFYDTLTRDRESHINAAMQKVLDQKRPLADAQGVLDEILSSKPN